MTVKSSNRQPQAIALKKILTRYSSFGWDEARDEAELPEDVPKGHFVVYVRTNRTRYIVPISWLDYLVFKTLHQAEEEYGFHHDLGIIIPCEEAVFLSLVSTLPQSI